MDGLGVALGPLPLIADELASGRLVTPLPGPRIATRSYWWIAPRETANDVLVGRFCAWLDAQAQAS
ncbi:DNA-binding transcriptional activator GcvA [Burkholderia pseudomallei]|nr:DNA-binding transcriptional activator GcvA [Burkholderia pseudomallei]